MPKLFRLFVVLTLLLLPAPAFAWNGRGHMTVAHIAYTSLPAPTRSRVDALLRQHPDFARLSQGLNQNSSTFGLRVFMVAATWPDIIKTDGRFHEDNQPATPLRPGFPSMKRHRNWHFIDMPFTQDGSQTAQPPSPNALEIMPQLRQSIGNNSVSASEQAYNLSWLIHLVGDVHQPLHATARFTRLHGRPDGDRGGVLFLVNDSAGALHFVWDDALGTATAFNSVRALGNALAAENAPENPVNTDEQDWINDSFAIAQESVYTLGQDYRVTPQGLRPRKPSISAAYRNTATRISRKQVALAGRRLAAIIEERLP
ncbi:MAG TPA: S1/P1 nuclease [Pyrinomonadaceae bacterium]|nr:S1/P1 nuclease [Pyrinomonadaceae bacterium]